jgi:hypothetical protein
MMKLRAMRRIEHEVGAIQEGQEFNAPVEHALRLIESGDAVTPETRVPWLPLHWADSTVVCVASGPSITAEDCAMVMAWRVADLTHHRVIVINTTYQLLPWADVLYACDERWWGMYYDRVRVSFAGQLWTQDEVAARRHTMLMRVRSEDRTGLSKVPGVIHDGENSGYQAVGLAYMAGAKRIILLGYDMQDHGTLSHWHGDHPKPLKAFPRFECWIRNFKTLANDLRSMNVDVVNATRRTALNCFPQLSLEAALWKE